MEAYIRRRHNRKLAQGARLSDLEKMLEFPDDEPPAKAYSPRQAEALWGDRLCDYELQEMRDYKEIYFAGTASAKKKNATMDSDSSANNYGYDDERGDYLVVDHDHLAYRYEVMSLLGRGSFGQVLQCRDHKTGKAVAIKLIRNKKRFHHQALVEVKILENLTKWDPNEEFNVIKMTESFYFRNHLCIAMELLSINLYELIKANNFAGFSTRLIRRFATQTLLSLSLMRHHRVVHCDLKPENILLRHPRKSAIKVIDFGSSCFEHEKGKFIRRAFRLQNSKLMPPSCSLHLHPESLLPLPRSYSRYELSHGDRYLESRLHSRRALLWLSSLPRRERAGAAGVYHGDSRHSRPVSHREELTQKAFLRLDGCAQTCGQQQRKAQKAGYKVIGLGA